MFLLNRIYSMCSESGNVQPRLSIYSMYCTKKNPKNAGLRASINIYIYKYNYDVNTACETPIVCFSLVLFLSGRRSHANCTRGRQSHANFRRFYSCCMRLAAKRVQFACDWWPLGYKLYATGRQSHANFACASGQLRAKLPDL